MNLNQLIPIYKNLLNRDDADAQAFSLNDRILQIHVVNLRDHPSWK